MEQALNSKEFLRELESFADQHRQMIEAEVDGFSTDKKQCEYRQSRSQTDFRFFCHQYFPHYVKTGESEFHKFVYEELPAIIDANEGSKEAIAAPRGEAKSTLLTQLSVLWCICTKRKHFVVIVMDSFDQSLMMLEAIKAELEANPRLRMDYAKAFGEGRVWQAGKVVTRNNVMVQTFGSGKRMRGLRHGAHRPDLVILDDIENDENVRSKTQRDKLHDWLNKTVLKLGSADGSMDVIYLGTILHYDSVLNRTLKNPIWRSHHFKALIEWPDRRDLWDLWEEKLRNEGLEASNAYYKKRKKLMDAGSKVSWPEARDLLTLMLIRADNHRAFETEMQNDPASDEHAPFKEIQFWVHTSQWVFYGSVDPSLGRKNKQRDPSAILVGGWDKSNNRLDVVEADVARKLPSLIINRVIDLQRDYSCVMWAVESVQFQEFMRTELIARSIEAGVPVSAKAVIPNTDKDLRIQSLQPYVENGNIRLHQSQTVAMEQLRHYPEADHDDFPDALEMLWTLATSNAAGIPSIKTAGGAAKYRGY